MTEDDAFHVYDILNQLRKNAEKGIVVPPLGKHSLFRALWLKERYKNNDLNSVYFHNEYRQFPESVKKQVEGARVG